MFKRKCKECGEKVDKKFNYCPWCGAGIKGVRASAVDDFGMLGSSDDDNVYDQLKLPFGMERVVDSLIKQLGKQLDNMDVGNDKGCMPKGIKIQIARSPLNEQIIQNNPVQKIELPKISSEESERRSKLKRVDAKSKIKRLGDIVIYEIEAPGLRKEEDVSITELETGIEVRAYSRDKCYIKIIPLKVEIVSWKVEKERVFIEVKG